MRVIYILDDVDLKTRYAVSQDCVWNGHLCEELLWAEIVPALGSYAVRWEDSYKDIIHLPALTDCYKHIENNWGRHKPHINGKTFKL